MDTMITIARDFSPSPSTRYRHEGPNSGQRFREELLEPALKLGGNVQVSFAGVVGFGSSFLEEAFGGLVRIGYRKADLEKRLHITDALPTHRNRVWRYITDESRRLGR